MSTDVVLFVLLLVQSACLVAVTVALLRRSEQGGASSRDIRRMLATLQQDQAQLAVLGERLEGLRPLTQSVGHIRDSITELQSRLRGREELERRTADAIHRLERVISGTQSRGAAGEHLLDAVFSQLPGLSRRCRTCNPPTRPWQPSIGSRVSCRNVSITYCGRGSSATAGLFIRSSWGTCHLRIRGSAMLVIWSCRRRCVTSTVWALRTLWDAALIC